ncbi:BTAD domain-containing putative transcriptional regulator [Cryptosporangium minutisporangium]|uniref:BTAD domain-containing putative transcriptional regulator n=1 Tax=Cryptosporangium minutisporangium TaxID=113569 RepID=UPI0031E888F3
MRVLGRLLRALGALLLLVASVGGVPWLLVVAVGWPLPRHVPTPSDVVAWLTSPIDDGGIFQIIACVTWILWAIWVGSLLLEAYDLIRYAGRSRPKPTGIQALAAALLTALTLNLSGAASYAQPPIPPATVAAATPLLPRPANPPILAIHDQRSTEARQPDGAGSDGAYPPWGTTTHTTERDGQTAALTRTRSSTTTTRVPRCVVQENDTLWDLAYNHLGEAERWEEIYTLNRGLIQADGRALSDPDLLIPGWVLVLPTRLPAPTPATPSPPAAPDKPDTPDGATGQPPPPQPTVPGPSPTPPRPTTPGPSTTAPSQSTSGTAAPSPLPPTAQDPAKDPATASRAEHGVELSGGWVSAGLAAAIADAGTLAWLRRRRVYRPEPLPGPNPQARDLHPLPPLIGTVREAAHELDAGLLEPCSPGPTVAQLADADSPDLPPPGPDGPQLAGLDDPLNPRGLGLTGDGAPAAARALLTATLAAGGPQDPDAAGTILIPAATLAEILGTAAVDLGPLPRLHVHPGLPDALTTLEDLIIARRRELDDHDAPDFETLHAAHPFHAPLPLALLIAEIPAPVLHARVTAALQLGSPLRIAAVFLGNWPPGDTLHVHLDGTTIRPPTGDRSEPPARLSVLDVSTAVAALEVLREAHTGTRPATAHSAAAAALIPDPGPAPHRVPSSADSPASTSPASFDHPAPTRGGPTDEPARVPAAVSGALPSTAATSGSPRARIQVLGQAPLIRPLDGPPVTGARSHAVELLALLAAHRDGMDLPDIMEVFYPTATVRRASQRLSTTVGNLRNRIRTAAGDPANKEKLEPVLNTGSHYQLNPAILHIDWWHFQDTLARAVTADDDQRLVTLRHAVDLWTGPLLDGCNYRWVESHREYSRRQGITAHIQLAALLTDAAPDEGASLLDAACGIDPINEDVARLAMRAHAQAGNRAAVQARLQALTAALADIDEDPDEATTRLADQLMSRTSAPRRSGPPPTETQRADGP